MGEVDSVRRVVDAMCAGIGRKVELVENYDRFRIDEALSDAYFAMVEGLHARHDSQATRYTASAFMRVKLGRALSTRQATVAVFESKAEAMTFWLGRRAMMGESSGRFRPIAVLRGGRLEEHIAAVAVGTRLRPYSRLPA